jgi:carboxyl-terminal processing protease
MEIEEKIKSELDSETEMLKAKKKMYKAIRIFLFIMLLAGFYWIGYEKGKVENANSLDPIGIQDANIKNASDLLHKDVDFSLFWKVWDLLKNKYVDSDKINANTLVYGAIKGMLQSTGDPYSNFFDPEENKKFNEDITGSFEGIGAELGIKNGILTVIAPLEGAPAEKAGLRAGDKIVKIDGKMTSDMGIEDAVNLIRGQKGTEVVLTIFRNGDQDTQDIKVQRNIINVKSVTLENKEAGIFDIKISRFGEDTTKDFVDILQKVTSQKPKGIIIDLRNNPGGYLESSIKIASKMLPKGKVVVIEEDGKKNQKKMYAEGGDTASSIPTVVLINEGSASASEILAGALKENRSDVTLVGKKSFGKGSVQQFITLPQGTAAKITIARWLTPNGNQINEKGITPDVEIEMTNDDYKNDRDPQLDEAIKLLREKLNK